MLIGILHGNTKVGRPGTCHVCKHRIEVGDLHVVIIVRYGKLQEAAFKLAVMQKRAWTKKAGLKYRRLHLQGCLSEWITFVYRSRTEARQKRKGRPKGTGQLPQMSDGWRKVRRRLVRRRAETLRQIMATEDGTRGRQLVERLKGLNEQLGVAVIEEMSHRTQTEVVALNKKLRRFMDGQASA